MPGRHLRPAENHNEADWHVLLDDKVAAATISPRSPGCLERFGKGSLGRYAVSDIVLPSTVFPIRHRD